MVVEASRISFVFLDFGLVYGYVSNRPEGDGFAVSVFSGIKEGPFGYKGSRDAFRWLEKHGGVAVAACLRLEPQDVFIIEVQVLFSQGVEVALLNLEQLNKGHYQGHVGGHVASFLQGFDAIFLQCVCFVVVHIFEESGPVAVGVEVAIVISQAFCVYRHLSEDVVETALVNLHVFVRQRLGQTVALLGAVVIPFVCIGYSHDQIPFSK